MTMNVISLRTFPSATPSLCCPSPSNAAPRQVSIRRVAIVCQARKGGFGQWFSARKNSSLEKVSKTKRAEEEVVAVSDKTPVTAPAKEVELEEAGTGGAPSGASNASAKEESEGSSSAVASHSSNVEAATPKEGESHDQPTAVLSALVDTTVANGGSREGLEDRGSSSAASVEISDKAKRIAALEHANQQLSELVAELEAALQLARVAAGGLARAEAGEESQAGEEEAPEEGAEAVVAPAAVPEEVEVAPDVAPQAPSWSSIQWPSPDDEVPFWLRPVAALPPSSSAAPPPPDGDRMSIVHVTAEMAPLAKVGGLADVVTGLARACLARGHSVQVLLPFYDCMDTTPIQGLALAHTYGSYHKGDWLQVQAHRGQIAGVPVVLIRPENHLFRGARIYGGAYSEMEAYLFFSRAALEYLQGTKQDPDILHVHEWQTAAVALLYWDMYHWLDLKKPRVVLTIHNMEHHGECKWEELSWCGLNGQSYLTVEKAMDERTIGHNPERLSLLKGGIVYSNAVTTVSPTYVQETLCSGWLAATLHTYRQKYTGILNGIDTQIWDPATDPCMPAPFTASDLANKALCKHYVQRGLGLELEVPDGSGGEGEASEARRIPLVVCVTRLVAQKGIHLIRHALYRTLEQGGQFVLLGSAPDPRVQGDFQRLADEFQASPNVRLLLTYSDALSHHLYAAGDMVLVPSMFEPCGLTQMIGMRYGTIPVVRRTGGLADTVFDVDSAADQARGNGFVFDGIDEGSLNQALDRALRYYKERPDWWAGLTAKVMAIDNSWNKSAGEYLDLYRSVRV